MSQAIHFLGEERVLWLAIWHLLYFEFQIGMAKILFQIASVNLSEVGPYMECEGQVSCWGNVTPQHAENHCEVHSECDIISAWSMHPGVPDCLNDDAERW